MHTGILIGHFEPLHLGHLQDINHASGLVDALHIVVMPKKGSRSFCPTLQDKARAVQVACEFFDFIKVHTADSLGISHDHSWAYDEMTTNQTAINDIIAALQLQTPTLFVKESLLHDNLTHDSMINTQPLIKTLPTNDFDSTVIYQNPIAYFHQIAPSARRDYTKTICIVGGESSGKTTLVHKLAGHYGASFALEMGRLYTHSDLGGTEIGLQYSDYPIIANQHYLAIQHALKNATSPITLIDTDFITTQAFCETYEQRTHPLLTTFCDTVRMNHTIMLDNNVKWVADGMRSLGSHEQRNTFENKLFELFERHHISPYVINDENYHDRYLSAVRYIDEVIFGK